VPLTCPTAARTKGLLPDNRFYRTSADLTCFDAQADLFPYLLNCGNRGPAGNDACNIAAALCVNDKRGNLFMRHRLIQAGAAAVVAGTVLSACGVPSATVNNTPASTQSAKPAASAATKTVAVMGSTINLTGDASGEKMAVQLTKVIQRAHGADEFTTPDAGKRFMAVQLKLSDIGSAAYSDSPSNGATVTDSHGQSYQADIWDVARCTSFPASETISTGSFGLGCIVFQVPKQAKIVQFQFALDSGFASDTGQWKL